MIPFSASASALARLLAVACVGTVVADGKRVWGVAFLEQFNQP